MAECLDTAEADETSKGFVYVEQGQPLRAVEPDEWTLKVRTKPIPGTLAQRQRCPECVSGTADDHHWRRQDARDSELDVASFDHCDILPEVGMYNKKLKSKVLVSHKSGEVAT